MKFPAFAVALLSAALFMSGAHAAQLVTNGSFATGDFTGWTIFSTVNGSLGPAPAPQVTAFDVTGLGATEAAEFRVGQVVYQGTGNTQQAGGGLSQTITTLAGVVLFSADVAILDTSGVGNADGGLFQLLLDGVPRAHFGGDEIGPNGLVRHHMQFITNVSEGSHTLDLLITRRFTNSGVPPFQYVTNISAMQGFVPEPATWTMMLVGFGLVGAGARRRRLTAVASVS